MEILLNKDSGIYGLSLYAKTEVLKKKNINFYIYIYVNYGRFYEKSTLPHAFQQDSFRDLRISKNDYNDVVEFDDAAFLNDLEKMEEIFKSRTDKDIIDVVKKLGEDANGFFSNIAIIEIPDDCFYEIVDYDGIETVFYSKTEIKRA